MIRMPYFPGCTLKTNAKNYDQSIKAIFRELGIDLVELPRWNCCGAVFSLSSDDLLRQVAPITNLLRTQELEGTDSVDDPRLVVPCAMCFNVLKRANQRVRENPEDLKKINDFLYLEAQPYAGKVQIVHPIELLMKFSRAEIEDKVRRPLKGLRVSLYYGCNLLRPKEVAIDNPEDPSVLEKITEMLGAEVVENPNRLRCCGSYQTVVDQRLVGDLVYDIVKGASRGGADLLITACPLCAFNLDFRQSDASKSHSDHKQLPILYFSELIALAFGMKNSFGGEHFVNPAPLMENFLKKEKGGI